MPLAPTGQVQTPNFTWTYFHPPPPFCCGWGEVEI